MTVVYTELMIKNIVVVFIWMSLGELIYHLDAGDKSHIRQYEKSLIRLTNAQWSVKFNNTCLKENLDKGVLKRGQNVPNIATMNSQLRAVQGQKVGEKTPTC